MQGPQGQARLHQGRGFRARNTRRQEVPPVQVRDSQGPQGIRGAGQLPRRLRREGLHPRRVRHHLQGHRQRHFPQQVRHRLGHWQDRGGDEQQHHPAAAEAVVRREADPHHVLRSALPRPPGLHRHHRRTGDLAPRMLAAEARGLPARHLQGARHPDDRRNAFAPDHPRQVGHGQGAEAYQCASS